MTRAGKVLIVDDDRDFTASLTTFLQSQGFSVLQAEDGKRGLALAKAEHPDLVIMDVMMNERTEGFFAVQEFRRTPGLEEVPIFVVSSLFAKTAQRLVTARPSGAAAASSIASSSVLPSRAHRPSTVSPVPAEQRSLASKTIPPTAFRARTE